MPTTERFDEMGVTVIASRRLRALGTPLALHEAEELEGLTDRLLDQALVEGSDVALALDEMPEGDEEEGGGLEDLEHELLELLRDVERAEHQDEMEEMTQLECPECVEDELEADELERAGTDQLPLGAPSQAAPAQPVAAAGARVKKGRRRRYVACSNPELRRTPDGRKAWCSLCAFRKAAGRLGWTYLPVGKNSLVKPRFALLSGRRVRFASDEDIERLLNR